jgi:hypothetical protein
MDRTDTLLGRFGVMIDPGKRARAGSGEAPEDPWLLSSVA